MEYVQQNINLQKTKLLNCINNLINTQLINQEIYINNEIKKESELLASLLEEKRKYLTNQMPINNGINPSFMFQPNLVVNAPQMNISPIQMPLQQTIDNNQNNFNILNQDNITNITFFPSIGGKYVVQSNANDKITDIIEKYRKKANDYSENTFYFNGIKINGLNFTLYEISPIKNFKDCRIDVVKRRILKGENL